jgi:uncharacterized membrane protein YvbJ
MPRKTKEAAGLPPLFYCDNCGAEVGQNDPACPKCGRRFASVLCPACGFSGEEALFDNGCPECGYQVLPGKGGTKNISAARQAKKNSGRRRQDGGVPFWSILLTFAVFVLALCFLLFYMSR